MGMRKLLLIATIFFSLYSSGQTPMFKLIAKKASSCSYLLDQYPGAAAAYSLRQLDCDYSGDAIRVRRSSDNTEDDIGFVNGNLDTASLKTFVGTSGSDNGFVVTWYDHSGNSLHMTQATQANQAKIIDAGVVLRVNSLPSALFAGKGYSVAVSFTFSELSAFAISTPTSAVSFSRILSTKTVGIGPDYSGTIIPILRDGVTGNWGSFRSGAMRATYTGVSSTVLNLFSSVVNTTTLYNQLNDNTEATYSTTLSGTCEYLLLNCSQPNGTTEGINGYISEVVYYNNNQYTNKSGIKTNINTYYSIY